jgi:hypothetical protein
LKTKKGMALRRCDPVVLFLFSSNLPEKHIEATRDSFRYWNEALEKDFFFDIGIINEDPSHFSRSTAEGVDYLVVGTAKVERFRKETTYAIASYISEKSGCMTNSMILFNEEYLDIDMDKFKSIMRHEIGHILGLAHTEEEERLMLHYIPNEGPHPMEASKEEILYLRKLYKTKEK